MRLVVYLDAQVGYFSKPEPLESLYEVYNRYDSLKPIIVMNKTGQEN